MDCETLNEPLSEKEKERLVLLEAQYEAKCAQGESLDPEAGELLVELWQRQNRSVALEKFREGCERSYFGEFEGVGADPERMKVYNYPSKVKCYQQKRQHRTTTQSIRQLIDDENKAQSELKEKAMRKANRQGDRDQMQIKFDFVERVYYDYEQFLVKELKELEIIQPAATLSATAKAALPVRTGTDRWAGLLINYTLADLNNLLVFVGLLETAEPLVVATDTKPAQWVAVAAAFYKSRKAKADKAALYRAFSDTYGQAVGSLSSFSREYNESNEAARKCYSRALSQLG